MQATTSYDYIITGAGCAGLSLAIHIINAGHFADKKILLVDQDAKNKNDRTWCFWEKDTGLFQPIVYKEWNQLRFHSDALTKPLDIAPYTYKLIRGIDFYEHCLSQLKAHNNITILQAPVERVVSNAEGTGIILNGEFIQCQFIFNSIIFNKPALTTKQCWLLQHFKGWRIRTEVPVFDATVGTLMDFRTSQEAGATFFYVLPFSPTEALVEYTLFSEKLLDGQAYDKALQHYITQTLEIDAYHVVEKEFGIIPMTNYAFTKQQGNIINLGTAGGQTKGSSGYTFQYIQKHSAALVKSLVQHGNPFHVAPQHGRFHFYDSVLLHILHHKKLRGADIFTDLFKKNKASKVFAFLDNETSITDELGIISSLPTLPFTKAAIQQFLP